MTLKQLNNWLKEGNSYINRTSNDIYAGDFAYYNDIYFVIFTRNKFFRVEEDNLKGHNVFTYNSFNYKLLNLIK
jgi:hypothetical protein